MRGDRTPGISLYIIKTFVIDVPTSLKPVKNSFAPEALASALKVDMNVAASLMPVFDIMTISSAIFALSEASEALIAIGRLDVNFYDPRIWQPASEPMRSLTTS